MGKSKLKDPDLATDFSFDINTLTRESLQQYFDLYSNIKFTVKVLCHSCKQPRKTLLLHCRHSMCFRCLRILTFEATENSLQEFDRVRCCERPVDRALIEQAFEGHLNEEIQNLPNIRLIVCCIDLREHAWEFGVELLCNHWFFRSNLRAYLEFKIGESRVAEADITCPECSRSLDLNEVQEVVSSAAFEKLSIKRSLNVGLAKELLITCPKCSFVFVKSKPKWYKRDKVKCIKCNSKFCRKCLQDPHTFRGCNGALRKRNKKQNELFSSIKMCPKCRNGVEKQDGCNFCRCPWPECKGTTYFCYLCDAVLSLSDHYGHFTNAHGPYGDSCNTLKSRSSTSRVPEPPRQPF
eukprot:CAMPEP_0204897968 /NCGR_PEP_ID=MMETSP1397-20131031/1021_1 /ASSEMBLY_ACC=CAM_ASM_000891 /TAXON_ID=49980 /ORGANISM="Climacostomum Climacostomum virens, Strain Stock W-24" /LENGTH=350 /DNA_ID=CAMNT_0052065753 /DNA_START=548 /DNA_END=1600 /DNA_ORIENTATION=-